MRFTSSFTVAMRTSPSELLIDLGYFSSSLVSVHTSFPRVIHPPRVFLGSPKRPRARHVRSLYTARVAPEKLPGREFMVISSQKNPGSWAHECLSRCQAAPPKNWRGPCPPSDPGLGFTTFCILFSPSSFFSLVPQHAPHAPLRPHTLFFSLTPQFLRHQRTSHTSPNARIPRGWESLPMPTPMDSSRDSA